MANHPLSLVKITWLGKYKKVLAETGDEAKAIFEAERAVRRAHGSSAKTDLYDIKILKDHFNGKLSADDPTVKHELQLLIQQAEIDWKEMYSGKNTQVTPEIIAEDYINNAKLTAGTERTLKMLKLLIALAVVLVGVLFYIIKR